MSLGRLITVGNRQNFNCVNPCVTEGYFLLTGPYWVGEQVAGRPPPCRHAGIQAVGPEALTSSAVVDTRPAAPFHPNPLHCSYMWIALLLLSPASWKHI